MITFACPSCRIQVGLVNPDQPGAWSTEVESGRYAFAYDGDAGVSSESQMPAFFVRAKCGNCDANLRVDFKVGFGGVSVLP